MAGLGAAKALSQTRPGSGLGQTWSLSGLAFRDLAGRAVFFGLILSVLAVSTMALVNARKWLDRPFAGFLSNERLVAAAVGQYHWTGTQAGIRYPDKLLRANGRPLTSAKDLEAEILTAEVGTPVRYLIDRGGELTEIAVPTMRFGWPDLLATFGITFTSGLIYLLIGAIVFVMKPDTVASWALLLGCWFFSLYNIIAFDDMTTHSGLVRVSIFAFGFLPAAFVHLSLVFPERKPFVDRSPGLQAVPYLCSAGLVLPFELLYPRPSFVPVYRALLAYFILAALILVTTTLHAYLRRASVLARQRAKVLLFGVTLAFPVPAVAHYLALSGATIGGLALKNNFVAIPIMIFPASIAYAIARHNLFDVDVYIKRAVGYAIMTGLVGLAYLSTQSLMSAWVVAHPILFALLVVLLFNPLNRRVQAAVDRIFFRKQFDYKETISAVSNALTSMLKLDQIVKQVVHTIRKEMFIDTVGLLVLERQKTEPSTFFVGDRADTAGLDRGPKEIVRDVPVAADDPLLALLRQERTLITTYDIAEDPRFADIRQECLQSFSRMDASLALPLLNQSEVTGALVLGRKKSGHFYSREDIDLLTTMADQAAVAIQNATTHEEVVRYAEELAQSLRRIQILESIKTNLSKFVPKTVQELIEESPEAPLFDKREVDVSVLFADITGYTRLSAQMELDQVNRLVERYFGAFLDEILRYGGDVNETAGDGLMVIFQDPDPRQHARSAVLAALAIQQRTREINAELSGQFEPIAMHVGVNSGIAAVGATKIEGAAGTRWTFTASGPTTNVASRLAALGEARAVILSEETRQRLGGEFNAEDLGLQSLKNVGQPIRAFRLTAQ